ncbi:hypothetical protein ACHWQZ_G017607 [Mnemiopsis leidyi]
MHLKEHLELQRVFDKNKTEGKDQKSFDKELIEMFQDLSSDDQESSADESYGNQQSSGDAVLKIEKDQRMRSGYCQNNKLFSSPKRKSSEME